MSAQKRRCGSHSTFDGEGKAAVIFSGGANLTTAKPATVLELKTLNSPYWVTLMRRNARGTPVVL